MMRIIILFLFITFFLQACSKNAKYEESKKATIEIEKFWLNFSDLNLHKLVEEGLQNNRDVLVAMINVNKAQAEVGITISDRLPSVNVQHKITRQRDSEKMNSTFRHSSYSSFLFSGIVSYQVDLWGKMAAANNAARAELAALNSTKKIVQFTIASEIMKAYFSIITLDNKIKVIERIVAINENLDQLRLKQFDVGYIDQTQRNLTNVDLQMIKIQYLQLKQELIKQEKALAVIIGKDVSSAIITRENSLDKIAINNLPSDISSKLLLQRPDIIAAEKMLEAAKFDIKVARAAFFPEISLSAMIGRSSNYSSDLFASKARTRNIALNTNFPIFNWGKTRDLVNIAKENKSQAEIEYQHNIRVAFMEGLTAIEEEKNNKQNFTLFKKNERSMASNLKVAEKKYRIGLFNKVNLFEVEKSYLNSKLSLLDGSLTYYNSRVSLYKAFAGTLK